MPEFSEEVRDKIIELRALRRLGTTIKVYETLTVEWPSPDGTVHYSVLPLEEVTSPPPEDIDAVPLTPIEARIIPDSSPDWFVPVQIDSSIGDEEISFEMWDADEAISQLMVDHGDGVKVTLSYWFPQVTLMLPIWHGHLELDDEITAERIKLKAVQGFRSAESDLPSRARYQYCSAPFGGLFTTVAEVAACTDCTYNLQASGGTVGINNPATSLPWTYCDRLSTASCVARGVDPLVHLSHRTITATVQNNQTHGPNLLSTSAGNETNLKDSVHVQMGERRVYGMPVMAFRRDLNSNHPDEGYFVALYEGGEGPISSISGARVTVNGKELPASGMHYNYRLGYVPENPVSSLSTHGYSGTWHILFVFGPTNPAEAGPSEASATAITSGLNNIRVYTDTETYTETTSTNRVWQIARMLCDKRWGAGYDYTDLDIQAFIDAAEWAEQWVNYTDPFGTVWNHIRAESRVDLIGKKMQQQFEDMCVAGRLSLPFLFDGKISIVPLKALSEIELAACPVFTDEGDEPNIVKDDGVSTLTFSRETGRDLINRIEATIDDRAYDYLEQPLRPVEDIDAQLRAAGSYNTDSRSRKKVNAKKYSLLGVTSESHGIKVQWSILDLGPGDSGGLRNNLSVTFKAWFLDTLDLHRDKVIKVASSRLTKFGFEYFRVKEMQREGDLIVEITAQAYNQDYMDAFEADDATPPGDMCSVDDDCPDGFECRIVNGYRRCVPYIPPPCDPAFGTITWTDGTFSIPIEPC